MSAVELTLHVLPGEWAVCRLPAGAALPAWATAGVWFSVTHTAAELSVVCTEALVPADVTAERGWRAVQVAGPLDFSLTGVLAALANPLAAAGVSLFAVSTYDTDYILVKAAHWEAARRAWQAAGHRFTD